MLTITNYNTKQNFSEHECVYPTPFFSPLSPTNCQFHEIKFHSANRDIVNDNKKRKKYTTTNLLSALNRLSESTSEDKSSNEEEDDEISIHSTDIANVVLDESYCPSGLERATYELAFEVRSQRHRLEYSLVEAFKQIEDKMNEVKYAEKRMKHHTDIYIWENETLLEFRRKRQKELNKVNVSIVLQMHHTQHIRKGEDFRDLSKVVLLDSSVLLRLGGRVDQLNLELLKTKRLHRINIVHLRRMNTDIQYMRSEITRLEENICQEMITKIGMIINLDELEEEILRKYVFELETTAEEDLRSHELEITKEKVRIQKRG